MLAVDVGGAVAGRARDRDAQAEVLPHAESQRRRRRARCGFIGYFTSIVSVSTFFELEVIRQSLARLPGRRR